MFASIRHWLMVNWGRPRNESTSPRRRGASPEALGRAILAARPRRLEILAETRDLLIGLPVTSRPELVDQVALCFAMYVCDLAASERNHDSGEYGLLDHSLEVARAAVGELVRPGFRVSEDPALNYREQPIWAYSGFVLGLLHDVGKVFDLDVVPPSQDMAWNPLQEPLAQFLERHGLRSSGKSSWRWKKGRGQNGHVWKGNVLVPYVLPPASKRLLGSRLCPLLDTFNRSYFEGQEELPLGPALRVVEVVRDWDRKLAGEAKPGTEDKPAQEWSEPASNASPVELQGSEKPSHQLELWSQDPAQRPQNAENAVAAPPVRTDPEPQDPRRRIIEAFTPTKLLESIRSWVRAGNLRRNHPTADLFICPDFIWLRYPQAFSNLLGELDVAWSGQAGQRLLAMLAQVPSVVPWTPGDVLVPAVPTHNGKRESHFVRIRVRDFLPEKELADLGSWIPGMRVLPPRSEGDRVHPRGRGEAPKR